MNNTTTGWVILIAALGMMAGLMGNELSNLHSWTEATTIAFVGKILVHFSVVIAAFVGGKIIPGPGDRRE